jgi:tetrahydrodipicolinate N-succinyltransferase
VSLDRAGVLYTDTGKPCTVGDDCTVGHLAIVHGASVGEYRDASSTSGQVVIDNPGDVEANR